jgi:2'-hydroxyisoflavone reductase
MLKIGAGAVAAMQLSRFARAGLSSAKTILILGGTGFLGPHLVRAALERGHKITLFNRNRSGSDRFPSVEKIRGDRQPGNKGDLSGLEDGRRWDAVIDVWANDPEVVMPVAKLVAERCGYYFFVSSIAVYADYTKIGIDERAPTRLDKPGYGGNKARSEKALVDLFGDRVGIARPSAIMGPGDESLSYHYWLSHLMRDQEIIAPGTGDDAFVEYVDVRDVATWIVNSVESSRSGIYNVHSSPTPFRTFLEESELGIGGKAKLVWVDNNFLQNDQHLHPFDNLPYWNPDRPGFEQISPAKANGAGFKPRPLRDTARDAWASYQQTVASDLTYPHKQYDFEWGISDTREKEILEAWKAKQARK